MAKKPVAKKKKVVKKAAKKGVKKGVKKAVKKAGKKVVKKSMKKGKKRTTKKKVSAIPKGYNSVTPYLIVDNAASALAYYQKCFGAKLAMRMDNPNGKVMHSELKIGDSK